MQNNKLDVGKILEELNKGSDGEPITDIGLVFEVEDEESAEKQTEPTPEAPAPEPPKAEEPVAVPEEFSVPEEFEVDERYDTPQSEDFTGGIHMTYVPRFTGASDNYKMREGTPTTPPVVEKPRTVVDDIQIPTTDIDPTAETVEEDVEGAVVVDMTKPLPDDGADLLNVYKFSEGEEEEKAEEPERTVEDEREEIESLLEIPTEDEEPSTEEPAKEAEPPKKAEDYELPDPDIEIPKEEKKEEPKAASAEAGQAKKPLILTEYTVPQQRDGFVQKFLDAIISQKIRLFSAIFFSVLILAFEVASSLGAFSDSIFGIRVTSMAVGIIDLLLSGCTLALALPEVLIAVKNLFSGRITPTLSIVSSYAYLLIYYCIIFAMGGVTGYPLFGFIYSIFAVAEIMSSTYRTTTDFEAFKLISKTEDMQVAKYNLTRDIPEENIALDGLIDEYKSRTVRARSTSFVNGFIKTCAKNANKNRRISLVLGVTLGISLISALVSYFAFGGLLSAAETFAVVNLLGVPVFILVSGSLAYYDSHKSLLQVDSCAAGELSYFDIADTKVIVFDDVDVFGPDDVNLKGYVFLGEGDNIDGTMRQMCSLFSVVGGPLGALFANALDNRMTTKKAANPEIEADGLSGDVGAHRVLAGTAEYMVRHGVEIPDAPQGGKIDTTKTLYAAEDGNLTAKFYVRYSFSEEFTMVLPLLKKEGIVPLIYTRDPNVSDELIKRLTTGNDSMRVMKLSTPIPAPEEERSRGEDATIVTAGDKMDIAGMVLHAKKHKRFSDRLAASGLYASVVGALLAALISFSGMLSVPALVFAVWQLSWCFVVRVVSRKSLAPERQRKNKGNE